MKLIFGFIIKYFYAIGSCLYLFLIGFLSARNRTLITGICRHFGYVKKKTEPIILKVELTEIIPEDICIQVREPIIVDGNVTLLETIVINRLTKFCKPVNIFEIGTFDGRATLNMASNSPENSKIYTLDLPKKNLNSTKLPIDPDDKSYIDKEISGSRFLSTNYKDKIIQLYGDSATFDFSPYNNMMDFIFIDGSHSYEYVLNDSKKALKLLNDGKGIILWHDYGGFDGVTRALNELYVENSESGVFKEIKHINETSLAYLNLE